MSEPYDVTLLSLRNELMAELELNRGSAQSLIADLEVVLQTRLNGLTKAVCDTVVSSTSNVIRRLEQTPVSVEEALKKATLDQLFEAIREHVEGL